MTDIVWADALVDEWMIDYANRLALDVPTLEANYFPVADQKADSYIVRAKTKDKQQQAPATIRVQ